MLAAPSAESSGNYLSAKEGLGVFRRRRALDAAEPHDRQEGVAGKPMLVRLGLKEPAQMIDFLLADFLIQRNEEIGDSEVAVVFGNLVLQNQMVPERIPREVRKNSMVLMTVVSIMRQN